MKMSPRALTVVLMSLLVAACSREREREAATPEASAPSVDANVALPWTELRLTLWSWQVGHTLIVRPDGTARHIPPLGIGPDAAPTGPEREVTLSPGDRAKVECAIATLAHGKERQWRVMHSSDSGFVVDLVAASPYPRPRCETVSAVGDLDGIAMRLRDEYRASLVRDR